VSGARSEGFVNRRKKRTTSGDQMTEFRTALRAGSGNVIDDLGN
jgi:hypothetical protein